MSGSHNPSEPSMKLSKIRSRIGTLPILLSRWLYLACYSSLAFMNASGPDSKGIVRSAMVMSFPLTSIMSGRSWPEDPGIFGVLGALLNHLWG